MASGRRRQLLRTGSPAPEFRLPLLDSGDAALPGIIAGGPALIAFFKINCPVCQFTFPFLERLRAPGVLGIYGVSQNDPAGTRGFNREFGVTFPVLLDLEERGFAASNAFGVSSVPTAFLIERDGTIANVIEGWVKRDYESLAGRVGIRLFRESDYVPEWKAG